MSAGSSDPWEIAVMMPARNEEALLARCLESVIRAINLLPATLKATIVFVSDSSTDRTVEIACSIMPHGAPFFIRVPER